MQRRKEGRKEIRNGENGKILGLTYTRLKFHVCFKKEEKGVREERGKVAMMNGKVCCWCVFFSFFSLFLPLPVPFFSPTLKQFFPHFFT